MGVVRVVCVACSLEEFVKPLSVVVAPVAEGLCEAEHVQHVFVPYAVQELCVCV